VVRRRCVKAHSAPKKNLYGGRLPLLLSVITIVTLHLRIDFFLTFL
jgi:hypothetical protein